MCDKIPSSLIVRANFVDSLTKRVPRLAYGSTLNVLTPFVEHVLTGVTSFSYLVDRLVLRPFSLNTKRSEAAVTVCYLVWFW